MQNKIDKELQSSKGKYLHGDIVKRVLSIIPQEESLYRLADFFRILGDTTRVKVIKALGISEMCVYDLAKLFNVTQSAMSHQLRILRQADIVKYRKAGKTMFYSLKDNHIGQIVNIGMEHITERNSV